MRVALVGMYPTEAFGMAPLMLKAAALGHTDLEDIEIDLHFSKGSPDGAYDVPRICSRIEEFRPAVIGVGCYLWNRPAVLDLGLELRRRFPRALLVVGGPEAETPKAAEEILLSSPFDFAVRGEGELVFAEMLARHRRGTLSSNPPESLSWVVGTGAVHRPQAPPTDPLDQLPSPFSHEIEDFRNLVRIPSFETYRGCIMRCKYCNWGKARGVRFFSLERIRRELDFILDLEIERIWFVDSVFNLDKERSKEILRYLDAHNQRQIAYELEMMAELLDDEQIELISRFPPGSGIAFGLQSTDREVLREATRPHNWSRFSYAIREIRRRAPQVDVALDLIYGLPKDRPERFKQSLLDAVDLGPSRIQVHPFRVLTGTGFAEETDRYGFREIGEGDYRMSLGRESTAADFDEYRWFSYWGNVYNSPRYRQWIEKLHASTSLARSTLLSEFMEEYESVLGRVYFGDLEPHEVDGWRADMQQVHSNLSTRCQSW